MGWCEVELPAWMVFKPGRYLLGLVYLQVVEHNVDILAVGYLALEVLEEVQELDSGVPVIDLTHDFTGVHQQRSEQSLGSVAAVLELAALGGADLHRLGLTHGLFCLYTGLLVDGDHDRIVWWVQVEPADLGLFGLKVGIDRGKPGTDLMGSKLCLFEDLVHPCLSHAHRLGEGAHRPVSMALRRIADGRFKDTHAVVVAVCGRLARAVLVGQPQNAQRLEAQAPLRDRHRRRAQAPGDLTRGHPVTGQQDNPRPEHFTLLGGGRPAEPAQLGPLIGGQLDLSGYEGHHETPC